MSNDEEILSTLDFTVEENEQAEGHAEKVQHLVEFREALMEKLQDAGELPGRTHYTQGTEQFMATAREAGFNERQAVALCVLVQTPRDVGFQLLTLASGHQPFEVVCQALIGALA